MAKPAVPQKTVEEVADEVGLYAIDAYYFVERGLATTTRAIRRGKKKKSGHVTGQELSEGLRDLAEKQWGRLAGVVLSRWGVYGTIDFGRIVYAMIDAGLMSKTDEDSLDDFRDVFDFAVFESAYKITAVRA